MIQKFLQLLSGQTSLGFGGSAFMRLCRNLKRHGFVLIAIGGFLVSTSIQSANAAVENTFSVTGNSPMGTDDVVSTTDETVDVIDAAPALTISKTSVTTEVDDTSDVINYTISIENTGNVSLTGISISDTLSQNGTDVTLTLSAPTGDTDGDGEIDVNETWEYTTSHTTTQPNLDDGNDLINEVTATFTETGTTEHKASHPVTVTQNNDVTVAKLADVASVNKAGDQIVYSITVTNNGTTTATGISVTDPIGPVECAVSGNTVIASLAAGANEVCTITYTVTQGDLDQRGARDGSAEDNEIDNTVTVTGLAGGTAFTIDNNETVDLDITPNLEIIKTSVLNDEVTVDNVAEKDETITYTFTVENTGNVTMTNITVSDTHNGFGTPPVPLGETIDTDVLPASDSSDITPNDGTWSILAPGDIITFTATYTVTQDDVDNLQ